MSKGKAKIEGQAKINHRKQAKIKSTAKHRREEQQYRKRRYYFCSRDKLESSRKSCWGKGKGRGREYEGESLRGGQRRGRSRGMEQTLREGLPEGESCYSYERKAMGTVARTRSGDKGLPEVSESEKPSERGHIRLRRGIGSCVTQKNHRNKNYVSESSAQDSKEVVSQPL